MMPDRPENPLLTADGLANPRHADAGRLARLRGWRIPAARDLSLKQEMSGIAREVRRLERSVGSLGEAWATLVPGPLAARTVILGVARAVLQVRCQDASTRYELERWLRAGGEHALVRAAGTRVIKVKLVL